MRPRTRNSKTPAPVDNRVTDASVGWLLQAGSVHIHLPVPTVRSRTLRLAASAAVAAAGVLLIARPGPLPAVAGALLLLPAVVQLVTLVRTLTGTRPRTVVPQSELTAALALLAGRLRESYDREERLARIHDPVPLRVSWREGDPTLADHASTVRERGSEPIDLSGELLDVLTVYDRLPERRLVVLGGAGAGKSVLALRLARRLLDPGEGDPARPVPVVLPIASWDPFAQGPLSWAAGRIAGLFPELGADGAVRHAIAGALLETGRILPVYDGFDELPATAQAKGLRELNRSLGPGRQLVLTSRPRAYRKAVADEDVLTAAAVVKIQPLTVSQLADFLPRTTRLISVDGTLTTKWDTVLARLRATGDDPAARELRRALSTPLMVGLARSAYSDTRADPAELLDRDRFPDHRAVESHLLDSFVPAVYDIALDDRVGRGPWDARRAERSLGFLAHRMRTVHTQELAWWRLDEALPRCAGTLASLAALAFAVAAVCWGGGGTAVTTQWPGGPVWLVLTALALLVLFAGWAALPRTAHPGPERLTFPRGWRFWEPVKTLTAPADTEANGPWRVLRDARRAAVAVTVMRLGQRGDGLFGFEALLLLGVPFLCYGAYAYSGEALDRALWGEWTAVAGCWLAAVLLHGLGRTAWGRYTVARAWFAARGTLPWRLNAFLRDAHRRGVLRQSGGFYHFRHMELRDRLAAGTALTERRERPVVRLLALAVHLASAGALIAWLITAPGGTKGEAGPYRTVPSDCSLLTVAQLAPVVSGAVVTGNSHGHCEWTGTGPGRSSRVELHARAMGPKGRASGIRQANTLLGRSQAHPLLKAVGDGARSRSYISSNGDSAEAEIHARTGNLYIRLLYEEDYADEDRVMGVAAILAQQVLHNAGAQPAPSRALASVPLPALPGDSLQARHRQVRPRLALPVWRGQERSELEEVEDTGIVYRRPHYTCVDAPGRPEKPLCGGLVQGHDAPVYLRWWTDVKKCGRTVCPKKAEDAFIRGFGWFDVEDANWKKPGGGVTHSEATAPMAGDAAFPDRTHVTGVQLLRTFMVGDQVHYLAFRMDIDARYADAARKALQDLVAQTDIPGG
ncbi:NACHT domain-containing protein [Streptomyces sp. NPDC055078]